MREIQLTRGKVAIVDDDDYEHLSSNKWMFMPSKMGNGYAMRLNRAGAKVQTIFMHRVIMNASAGVMIDHVNGNGLDNRKSNLRFCTHTGNNRNRRPRIGKYKGVKPNGKKWAANIEEAGNRWYLGTFDTPEAAALAYNEAAKKYHGEFAHLNVIKGAHNG